MKNFLKISSLFVLFFVIFTANNVEAGVTDRVKGYAWSDTVGWISFNCFNDDSCTTSDYGVDIDMSAATTEQVRGEAWSDTVGWISFDYCRDVGGCTAPTYDETTGRLYGDAIALTGLLDLDDGWDGIIRLSEFSGSPSYGPQLNVSEEFDGYSWGSEVVGWVSYNCDNDSTCATSDYDVYLEAFVFNFTASDGLTEDSKAPHQSDVVLSWQTVGCLDTGSCSCSPSNGTTGWQGLFPVGIGDPTDTTFTVVDIEKDTSSPSDNDFTLECTNGTSSIQRDLHIYVKSPTPTVILSADDTNIEYDTSTTLRWSTANVDSCILSGPVDFTPPVSVPTGIGQFDDTGNLTALDNYYEIECIPSDTDDYPSSPYNPVIASVTVSVEKLIVDYYADHNPLPFNDTFTINWDTEFADSCTASITPGVGYQTVLLGECASGNNCGLSGNFSGATSDNASEEIGSRSFVSLEQAEEGYMYQARLQCTGNGGQSFDDTLLLRVGKNPIFIEN